MLTVLYTEGIQNLYISDHLYLRTVFLGARGFAVSKSK